MPFPSVITKMGDAIRSLDRDKLAHEVFEDKTLQAQILDLNTEFQMYEMGVDAAGIPLGDYAPITIEHYKPLAAAEGRDGRTDHITLKDYGVFYDSFLFRNEADGFTIEADTRKENTDLLTIYPQLLGLTDESIREIIPEVRERYIQQIRGRLFT